MSGPSADHSRNTPELTEGALKPSADSHVVLELPEDEGVMEFLAILDSEQAFELVAETLAKAGVQISFEDAVAADSNRSGYAELFRGSGPNDERVILKMIGANSRDVPESDLYKFLEGDRDTLLRANRVGIEAAPKLLMEVRFADGQLAAVLMEEVIYSEGNTVFELVQTLDDSERKALGQKIVTLLQRMEQECGLKLFDLQLHDLVIDNRGDLRFLDGGSFSIRPCTPETQENVTRRLRRVISTGSLYEEDSEEAD